MAKTKRTSYGASYDDATPQAAEGATVDFTAFTAANPSVGTATDASALVAGDWLEIKTTAGDPATTAAIDGTLAQVGAVSGNDVPLVGLDLSTYSVEGLLATGTVVAPPDPPEPPDPDNQPGAIAAQLLATHPSPGVGVLPVEPKGLDELKTKLAAT